MIPAVMDALADTVAAKDLAVAALADINAAMATLEGLVEAIQEGPVASVAGRTGVITLAIADIVGLVDLLAAKASTSALSTGLAGKQDAAAVLGAVAALTWATDRLFYSTGPGTFSLTSFTSAARSLLDDTSAGAMLTTLGFSDFAKTLIDDADQATAQATLGIPTKASGAEVITGTDDAKFTTAAGVAGAYTPLTAGIVTDATTARTLSAGDNGKIIRFTSGSAIAVTMPNNMPAGFNCACIQKGAGQITFNAGSGASKTSFGAKYKSAGQHAMVSIVVETNTGTNAAYVLGGNLVA